MKKIPFDEKELNIIREYPDRIPGRTGMNRQYDRPISEKENYRLLFADEHPMWLTGRSANIVFSPTCIPDNPARAFVFDGSGYDNTKGGGRDMFGVPWVYVPVVGGCLEDPNIPHLMEDANDWEKVIQFPDIDSWDWEKSARENKEYLNSGMWNLFYLMNGAWFERLISFMGFENAALALIDEDQEDAVKALFDKTTDLYIRIVDKIVEYFPEVDAVFMHDDWGSQRAPIFSPETCQRMIVPYMKRFTDHVKSKGLVAELHSCGCNQSLIQCMIDGGFQAWTPQPMNDSEWLFQNYGDKITITFNLEIKEGMTEEDAREMAREFVKTHCVPGKNLRITVNSNTAAYQKSIDGRKQKLDRSVAFDPVQMALEEELYKQSRLAYLSF